jgi:DNA-binding transcriptional MerR regulator
MTKNDIWAAAAEAEETGSKAPGRRAGRRSADERLSGIGDLAREFGVTLRTLRFYEDRGLLHPQRQGMARLYGQRDRARLAMILKGKQLGFTLGEIGAMIAESGEIDKAAPEGLNLSAEQIDEQIAHLERQRSEIDSAIEELEQARGRLLGTGKRRSSAR